MNRPGNCYASMIAPIAGFQIKGALWHQGFNNALVPNGHVLYYQVFAKMIGAWREAFNDPKMPFGIISLCTEGDPQDLANYLEKVANEGIYIREVQYKTFLDFQKAGDKDVGFASSFDQRRAWYHPQIKIPVGERIAGWALVTQYGKSGDNMNERHSMSLSWPLGCVQFQASHSKAESRRRLALGLASINWRIKTMSATVTDRPRNRNIVCVSTDMKPVYRLFCGTQVEMNSLYPAGSMGFHIGAVVVALGLPFQSSNCN
jgi:hypothetical protein